jgi:hypothetical protein
MKDFFKYISAKHFFTDYCNEVKNFTHKMRGVDGNQKPIDFTDADKKEIKAAFKKLSSDLLKQF